MLIWGTEEPGIMQSKASGVFTAVLGQRAQNNSMGHWRPDPGPLGGKEREVIRIH